MPGDDKEFWRAASGAQRIAEEILDRAPQDLVFLMRFLGESQYLLQAHFREVIEKGLAARNVTRDGHPFLQVFIDSHATELREFVFTGMSMTRQFRIREIETLTGDTFQMMRMDIWDALVGNIEAAERRFAAELESLPEVLAEVERSKTGADGKAGRDA